MQQSKCCIYIFSPKCFKLSNIRIIFSFEARGGGGGGGGGSNSTILFHLTFLSDSLKKNTYYANILRILVSRESLMFAFLK